MSELHLTRKDFKLEWFSGSGGGGQHRNKHQNCCRITHIETGISAIGTASKERVSNQKHAFANLAARLMQHYACPLERRVDGERVRTYHEPDNRVTDESGCSGTYKQIVIKGDIGPMIECRRQAMA